MITFSQVFEYGVLIYFGLSLLGLILCLVATIGLICWIEIIHLYKKVYLIVRRLITQRQSVEDQFYQSDQVTL